MNDADEGEPIRPATVHRAYGRGAAGFDGFVKSIPGYHAHLRMSTTRMGLSGGSSLRLLDIGCGTGASTAALLDAAPGAEVVAVDASADMLAVARRKNWPPRVSFVHSRLETLADAGVEGPFDGILAAYLVSNLPDAEIGLRRILSLLRPGAPLAVHDYAVADRFSSRMRWAVASWTYLIPMARFRLGSAELLRYRAQRVRTSDGVEAMSHRMQRAGFEDVRVQTVSGWQQHVVYTFLGRRPDEPDVVGQRRAARAAAAVAEPEEAPGPEDAGGPDDAGYADDARYADDGPDRRGTDRGAGRGDVVDRGNAPVDDRDDLDLDDRGEDVVDAEIVDVRRARAPDADGIVDAELVADPDADTPPSGTPRVPR